MPNRITDQCAIEICERMSASVELFGDANRALREDRPEDAHEALKEAQLRIVGAVALAEWAVRLKANRRTG